MRFRKLSPTGDFTFGGNLANFYINVPEAPGQAVRTRLLLFLGEWFLNTDEGMPWFSGVLGKFPQSLADQTIQDRVLGTQGIIDIAKYESQLDSVTRNFSVALTVDTQYGQAEISVIGTGLGGRLLTQDNIVITTQGGDPITT